MWVAGYLYQNHGVSQLFGHPDRGLRSRFCARFWVRSLRPPHPILLASMNEHLNRARKTIPMIPVPQIVPSHVCLSCEVCCRFPERDSSFRPYFTETEIRQAIATGLDASHFPDSAGSQVLAVPHPFGEGYLCPAFDPETFHCRVYPVRPFDCQLYPFVLMWDEDRRAVSLCWDTKCPFFMNPDMGEEPTLGAGNTPVRSYTLPEHFHPFSQSMAERIESNEMIDMLSANPQLVMPFQNDVVFIQQLPRLTKRLITS